RRLVAVKGRETCPPPRNSLESSSHGTLENPLNRPPVSGKPVEAGPVSRCARSWCGSPNLRAIQRRVVSLSPYHVSVYEIAISPPGSCLLVAGVFSGRFAAAPSSVAPAIFRHPTADQPGNCADTQYFQRHRSSHRDLPRPGRLVGPGDLAWLEHDAQPH